MRAFAPLVGNEVFGVDVCTLEGDVFAESVRAASGVILTCKKGGTEHLQQSTMDGYPQHWYW